MDKFIYVLDFPSVQGTIQRMSNELSSAFSKLGYAVKRLDLMQEQSVRLFIGDLDSGHVSLILTVGGYNPLLFQIGTYCTERRVPYFFFGFDNPAVGAMGYSQLLQHFTEAFISFTSETFVDAAPHILGNRGHFVALQQAASSELAFTSDNRGDEGLFVGNVSPHPSVNNCAFGPEFFNDFWMKLPKEVGKVLFDLREKYLRARDQSIFELLPPANNFGHGFDYARMMVELDYALYFESRMLTLQALIADHPSIVCGIGWDHFLSNPGKVKFQGSVPNSEVIACMARAQFLVNSMTSYYGCSERVLEAAMIGCPVITTPTKFLRDEFGDAVWYYTDRASLKNAVDEIRSGQGVYERVRRAREIALARHTWESRARNICQILESHGFEIAINQRPNSPI